MAQDFTLRAAELSNVPAIQELIGHSARALSRGYYDEREIDAAVAHVFGVDSTLIEDGTYFVAEAGDPRLIGGGGWSKRRTLFGGDQYASRDAAFSDPTTEAAKIRAFFVHPDAARRGVGRAILARCEAEARSAGYGRAELMSTLPGVPFYRTCGYTAEERVLVGVSAMQLEFVPMTKCLPHRFSGR
jgi:GNAT superfamily N-acetyltransferase